MALIEFPDIVDAPGVPLLRRAAAAASTIAGTSAIGTALQSLGIFSFDKTFGVYKNGAPFLNPDTMVVCDVKADSEIANHPVEKGYFASYNKTKTPTEISVQLACTGGLLGVDFGTDSRSTFLELLDGMVNDLDVYDIVTPDKTYTNFNLVHYDYQKTNTNGITMVLANCRFRELMLTATLTIDEPAQPDGNSSQNGGQASTTPPTQSQAANGVYSGGAR